jgi:hypothetical protein
MTSWKISYDNKDYVYEGKTPGAAAYQFFKYAINNNIMKARPKPDDAGGWEGVEIKKG